MLHYVLNQVVGHVCAVNADQPHHQVRGSFDIHFSRLDGKGQQLGSVLLVTALAQQQLQHVVIVTVDLVLILGHLLLQELPVLSL